MLSDASPWQPAQDRPELRLLVVGDGPTELFDVDQGSSEVETLAAPAALLPTGAALSVADPDANLLVDGELVSLSPTPRTGHTLTALEDGSALVAGGAGRAGRTGRPK